MHRKILCSIDLYTHNETTISNIFIQGKDNDKLIYLETYQIRNTQGRALKFL